MKKIVSIIMIAVLIFSLSSCTSSKAKNVSDLINGLTNVSLTSGKAIETAEAAYNALSDNQKKSVKNYDTLVDARTYYDKIMNVYTLIESIGTVTKESEDAILAAEKAYQALTIEERVAITNVSVLTAARSNFDAIPTVITLTPENFKNYFTFEDSLSSTRSKADGYYQIKVLGNIYAKQTTTLEALDNVNVTVRVYYSVSHYKNSSSKEKFNRDYTMDLTISISATTGSGSAYFDTHSRFTNPVYYPSFSVTSYEVISVTGTVTAANK
ncbi:MAG: hypothetical protein IKB88_01500 [Clostridia bacterium]|nr:hypothetical protein [Clostridia bacterium]